MRIATFGMFGVILLSGCGAAERTDDARYEAESTSSLQAISPAPEGTMVVDAKLLKLMGTSQWALHLVVNFNDEKMRQQHPSFDNQEKLFVEIPNQERIYLQHLDAGAGGLDSLFSSYTNIHDNDIGPVLDQGIYVGADTNVGEFLMQVAPYVRGSAER